MNYNNSINKLRLRIAWTQVQAWAVTGRLLWLSLRRGGTVWDHLEREIREERRRAPRIGDRANYKRAIDLEFRKRTAVYSAKELLEVSMNLSALGTRMILATKGMKAKFLERRRVARQVRKLRLISSALDRGATVEAVV